MAATNQEQQIGEAPETDERQLIASQGHGSDNLGALATGARDPSGQADDPTGRLGNEPRGDLTILETGAASDRAERKSNKTVTLQDLNAHSSPPKPNAPRALATRQGVEHEQGDDDASSSGTQRGKTKGAFAANLSDAQTARPRVAEFESDKGARSAIAAAVKNDKQRARSARPSTSVAHSELRWSSADEPFVGADGRIR